MTTTPTTRPLTEKQRETFRRTARFIRESAEKRYGAKTPEEAIVRGVRIVSMERPLRGKLVGLGLAELLPQERPFEEPGLTLTEKGLAEIGVSRFELAELISEAEKRVEEERAEYERASAARKEEWERLSKAFAGLEAGGESLEEYAREFGEGRFSGKVISTEALAVIAERILSLEEAAVAAVVEARGKAA